MRNYCLLLLLLASGCSHLPSHVWYQSHDELIANKQYKKALEQLHLSDPKDTRLINKTKKQARLYRQAQLLKIDRLIVQKKWGEARSEISHLIESQPWHDSYSITQERLDKKQKEELRVLETKQALAKANLLKANVLIDNYQQREAPSFSLLFSRKTTLEEEKQVLAKQLFELSISALAVQDYHNAQQTYAQALLLDKNLKATLLSDAINLGVYQSNQTAIQTKQARLLKKLKQAISEEDFENMIQLQGILSKPPFEGKNVANALLKATQKRNDTALALDHRADNVYRDGNITLAISLWQKAQNLAPSLLGVQDKLARAIKVQKKLAKLRQNQS